MRTQRYRAGGAPIGKKVPSNDGVKTKDGGFDPAPSKVTVVAWRSVSCAGTALAMSSAARRRATEVAKNFIIEI